MCTQHIGKTIILFTVFLTLSTALPLESSLRKDTNGCYPHEFRCHNRYYCINSRYVCDEIDDCGDLSDESYCSNKQCFHGEFLCSSNGIYVCHPNHYKCDGEPDCDDQSDERNCKLKRSDENLLDHLKRPLSAKSPFYFYKARPFY
ncbi:low-density lipoprotein receptor-related protein 8-like [Mytilus edulis]|uniref:low-density lipoprotein receptor-related protein 8-like n=1 Tax=Mytilus edulis TaxID=6550 RepID=UPI0039EEE5CB